MTSLTEHLPTPFLRLESLEPRTLLALAAYFQPVPIAPDAIEADPKLASYETWDVKIRVYAGDSYTCSDLVASLADGSFYNTFVPEPEPDGGNGNVAHPNLWAPHPNLRYDTWVSVPLMTLDAARVAGRGADQSGGAVFNANQVSVTWGELANPHAGAGDFTIARLTVSTGAQGSIAGRIGHLKTVGYGEPGEFVRYAFQIGTPISPPTVPPTDPAPPAQPKPPAVVAPPPPGAPTYGYVSGSVFADLDSDGVRDPEEIAMIGRPVWLDANRNGKLDKGERYTRVRLDGGWSLSRIPLGNHMFRVSTPAGFWRTSPGNGAHVIALTEHGQRADNRSFGLSNKPILRATVFEDSNYNGRFDGLERKRFGVRVFIDTDEDGRFDAGERSAFTNDAGLVTFRDLPAGGSYRIGIVLPAGTFGTTPISQRITFTTGGSAPTLNFGIR